MNKLVSMIVSIPLAGMIIVFSLVNRDPVTLDFWPLTLTASIPVFAIILISLMIGVLWGGLAAWLAAGRVRKRAREMSYRVSAAEIEIRQLEEQNSRLQHDLKSTRNEPGNVAKALLPPADAA